MADTVPPWLASAESKIGKLNDGQDVVRLAQELARAFPAQANYWSQARPSTPWCGVFVAHELMLAGVAVAGPRADGVGPMYVDWWLDFGNEIAVGQEIQLGDIAIWLGKPHHVSFVAGGGQYIGGNQSDGVTRAPYRQPDAIRRPPAPEAPALPRPAARRFENIWATVFADSEVAYADVAPGWNDRPGVALPALFTGARPQVRVINAENNLSVVCEIVDQGPWNFTSKRLGKPGDPYWLTGMRPQAESGIDMTGRATNGAGIDLTPAAARAIGFKLVERDGKIIAGGGLVHWKFVGEQIFIPPQDKGKPMPEPMPDTPKQFNAALEDCMRELTEAQRPIVERYLKSSQASTSGSAIDDLIIRLGGTPPARTGQVLLPPPAPPAKPEVQSPVPPAAQPEAPAITPVDTTPGLKKPSVALSTIASAATIFAQLMGWLPAGVGEAANTTGIALTAAPILTGLVGASGGLGMIANIGIGLLNYFMKSRTAK